MYRPNLLRLAFLISVATLRTDDVCAQHYGGYQQQMPGIHIPQSSYQPPIEDHYVGQRPKLWDDQQPIEMFLTELARRSWFRVDYMHMEFERPRSAVLGAPVLNAANPLLVTDNLNGGLATGVGVIPTLAPMSLANVSGIRGTWGLDLHQADFELQFFGTENQQDSFTLTNLQGFRTTGLEATGTVARPNIVTPLLSSGAASDAASANYFIYDDSFDARIQGTMWGAEATLLTKPYVPGEGAAWQWLGGFRYLQYDEEFSQTGSFNNGGLLANNRITQIGGRTSNNMYGPEIGGRASLIHRWFTLSATPRVAFTLNDYTAKTISGPLVDPTDPTNVISSNDVDFTPLFQLSLTGEIHLTPNLSFFGGYDFMWMYRITRPFNNVVYDSDPGVGGAFVPNIGQRVDLEPFYTKGLNFGFVFRY